MSTGLAPQAEPETDDDTDDTRKMDGVLKAISSILRTIRPLDEAAQERIVRYVASRFAAASVMDEVALRR